MIKRRPVVVPGGLAEGPSQLRAADNPFRRRLFRPVNNERQPARVFINIITSQFNNNNTREQSAQAKQAAAAQRQRARATSRTRHLLARSPFRSRSLSLQTSVPSARRDTEANKPTERERVLEKIRQAERGLVSRRTARRPTSSSAVGTVVGVVAPRRGRPRKTVFGGVESA